MDHPILFLYIHSSFFSSLVNSSFFSIFILHPCFFILVSSFSVPGFFALQPSSFVLTSLFIHFRLNLDIGHCLVLGQSLVLTSYFCFIGSFLDPSFQAFVLLSFLCEFFNLSVFLTEFSYSFLFALFRFTFLQEFFLFIFSHGVSDL